MIYLIKRTHLPDFRRYVRKYENYSFRDFVLKEPSSSEMVVTYDPEELDLVRFHMETFHNGDFQFLSHDHIPSRLQMVVEANFRSSDVSNGYFVYGDLDEDDTYTGSNGTMLNGVDNTDLDSVSTLLGTSGDSIWAPGGVATDIEVDSFAVTVIGDVFNAIKSMSVGFADVTFNAKLPVGYKVVGSYNTSKKYFNMSVSYQMKDYDTKGLAQRLKIFILAKDENSTVNRYRIYSFTTVSVDGTPEGDYTLEDEVVMKAGYVVQGFYSNGSGFAFLLESPHSLYSLAFGGTQDDNFNQMVRRLWSTIKDASNFSVVSHSSDLTSFFAAVFASHTNLFYEGTIFSESYVVDDGSNTYHLLKDGKLVFGQAFGSYVMVEDWEGTNHIVDPNIGTNATDQTFTIKCYHVGYVDSDGVYEAPFPVLGHLGLIVPNLTYKGDNIGNCTFNYHLSTDDIALCCVKCQNYVIRGVRRIESIGYMYLFNRSCGTMKDSQFWGSVMMYSENFGDNIQTQEGPFLDMIAWGPNGHMYVQQSNNTWPVLDVEECSGHVVGVSSDIRLKLTFADNMAFEYDKFVYEFSQ